MTDIGLTEPEHRALKLTTDLWNLLVQEVVGRDDVSCEQDLRELAAHIHGIQHAIMGQAAARAHPDRYRLLGEVGAWTKEVSDGQET